ncbi:MAG: peptide chain release factor N(5)-glutamine methyltransferase [Candidatus Saccharicenans sp.]|uniref:peptide chain release factor N(5)-glutamine methyltransferase n=1 Tax=Candidatus Saccharicenans sp. TaxID=2819258 RepID=UPI004049650A
MKYKNLEQLFRQTASRFSLSSCPLLEARLLIQKAAGWDGSEFYRRLDSPPSPLLLRKLEALVRQRQAGWPVAYLLGRKEFWSLEFKVNRLVLIPRPETELVVEKVLSLSLPDDCQLLDVGTGCGNLAVALAREKPRARVVASDISRRALKLAAENARNNRVKNIKFVHSDLLDYFIKRKMQFEVIVSNPPYVSESDWEKLDRPVKDFEPKKALVAGPTGLEIIARLVSQAGQCLRPGGFLVFEFGAGQEKEIVKLFGPGWCSPEVTRDYSGQPRVMTIRKAVGS